VCMLPSWSRQGEGLAANVGLAASRINAKAAIMICIFDLRRLTGAPDGKRSVVTLAWSSLVGCDLTCLPTRASIATEYSRYLEAFVSHIERITRLNFVSKLNLWETK